VQKSFLKVQKSFLKFQKKLMMHIYIHHIYIDDTAPEFIPLVLPPKPPAVVSQSNNNNNNNNLVASNNNNNTKAGEQSHNVSPKRVSNNNNNNFTLNGEKVDVIVSKTKKSPFEQLKEQEKLLREKVKASDVSPNKKLKTYSDLGLLFLFLYILYNKTNNY
jgi:hypothetical protein